MTEEQMIADIKRRWNIAEDIPVETVTIPTAALADLIALSQHGRTLLTATALALRSGIANTVAYSDSLLAEADDLDRKLWRAISGLWK